MSILVDSLFGSREQIRNVWCTCKPKNRTPFWQRVVDVFGVLSGRYLAVKFVATELRKSKKFREEFEAVRPEEIEAIKKTALDIVLKRHGKMTKFGDLKVGRNENCPCGSGKKFKECHGMLT